MIKPQCEFTGNRCIKDTCENCSIYAIHCLTEATENVVEEAYDKYYDTAGNLHCTGTLSGEHNIEAEGE